MPVDAPALKSPAVARAPLAARSDDEFSPLTEVVVGTVAGARIPTLDRSAWLNLYPDLSAAELATIRCGAFPAQVIAEAEEDLDALASSLHGLGVTVHRPAPVDHDSEFATPHWRTSGFYSYCPRDLALVVGSTIIQAPSPMRARMFELAGLRALFQQCVLGGSAWFAAPTPQLLDELYPLDDRGLPTLAETEPVFDAANVLRCGRDLFYLVSGSGNELGRAWLETTLAPFGDYRVHPIRNIYSHTHIDSTISLIRPGLVLLNPARVTEDALPEPLRSWDHLWCPPMDKSARPATGHPLSSEWIGMNLLMIRPDLAIVDTAQRDLVAVLQRRGVDVIPHTLRHARVLGGGFHCVTLDLRCDPPLGGHSDTPHRETPMIEYNHDTAARPVGSPAARYAELRKIPAALAILQARSRLLDALRRFLHDTGHIEVDTPLLQRSRPAPGRSLRTETRSLDPHIYLRSSPLHLRAMLTVGIDRVFEIGRSFRDEPVDPTHSPEYSLVELYQADTDYHSMRAVAHELITTAARVVVGGTTVRSRTGHSIDLASDWKIIPFSEAISAALGHQITIDTKAEDLHELACDHRVPVRPTAGADEVLLELYGSACRAGHRHPDRLHRLPRGPVPSGADLRPRPSAGTEMGPGHRWPRDRHRLHRTRRRR